MADMYVLDNLLADAAAQASRPALHEAFRYLKGAVAPTPGQLLRCGETALRLEEWVVAAECVRQMRLAPAPGATRVEEARQLLLEAAVGAHAKPFSAADVTAIDDTYGLAAGVVQGLAVAATCWPQSAPVLLRGLDLLWELLAPLAGGRHAAPAVDVVGFVLQLLERLAVGGIALRLQWLVRHAQVLRAVQQPRDAYAQLMAATALAAQHGEERLHVQLVRAAAVLAPEVPELAAGGVAPSGRQARDQAAAALPVVPRTPVEHAAALAQLVLRGLADPAESAAELSALHEQLIAPPPPPAADETAAPSRGKTGRRRPSAMTGGGGGAAGGHDAGLTTAARSPEVRHDVLADVVLCLCLVPASAALVAPESLEASLQLLRHGPSPRGRVFASYATVAREAAAEGLLGLASCPDVSYLSPRAVERLRQQRAAVEKALDAARAVPDAAERAYAQRVGCTLLWNLCLPVLPRHDGSAASERAVGALRTALPRIAAGLRDAGPAAAALWLRAEHELCLTALEDDQLGVVLARVDAARRAGAAAGTGGGLASCMDFPLLWLRQRALARGSDEAAPGVGVALRAVEQTRAAGPPSLRAQRLSAAFSVLPPLAPVAAAADGGPALPPRSVVQLYDSLLGECLREAAQPALARVVAGVAGALAALVVPQTPAHRDVLAIVARAHLALGTAAEAEETAVQHLRKAAALGVAVDGVGGSGAWLTLSACQAFLNRRLNSAAAAAAAGVPPAPLEVAAGPPGGKDGGGSGRHNRPPAVEVSDISAATTDLRAMHEALATLRLQPAREHRLVEDVALFYILALLGDHQRARGGWAGGAAAFDVAAALAAAHRQMLPDAGSAPLRLALDVCRETMTRLPAPHHKAHLALLYPALVRLAGAAAAKTDPAVAGAPPALQLLLLLGRMEGPMAPDERRRLLITEAAALLAQAPAVQLCGRVAAVAASLGEELLVLRAGALAGRLFRGGQLAWASATEADARPTPADWYWYSLLQLLQAAVHERARARLPLEGRLALGAQEVLLLTNAALAACHAPAAARAALVAEAMRRYARAAGKLWRAGAPPDALLPSLQHMLSRPVVAAVGGRAEWPLMLSLAQLLQRCCTACGGREAEGLAGLQSLRAAAPAALHSALLSLETALRCQLGSYRPPPRTDAAAVSEEELAALVHVARNTADRGQAAAAWRVAAAALAGHPARQAAAMVEMVARLGDADGAAALDARGTRRLLLAALALVEGVAGGPGEAAVARWCQSEAAQQWQRADPRLAPLPPRLLAGLLGRTTLRVARGASSQAERQLQALRRSAGPPVSLAELQLALRAMLLLYAAAPEGGDSGSAAAAPAAGEEAAAPVEPSRAECLALLAHYVECLWRVAHDTGAPEGAEPAAEAALPQDAAGWAAFAATAAPTAAFIAGATAADEAANTEALQSMLLQLCGDLTAAAMEAQVFAVLAWLRFAAAWRYGAGDCRAAAMGRLVALRVAAAATAGGLHPLELPPPPARTLAELAPLRDALRVAPPPAPPRSGAWLVRRAAAGCLAEVLLAEADALAEHGGRWDEAAALAALVQQAAARHGDGALVARAVRLQLRRQDVVEAAPAAALRLLDGPDGAAVLAAAPLAEWVALQTAVAGAQTRLRRWRALGATAAAVRAVLSRAPPAAGSWAAAVYGCARDRLALRFAEALARLLDGARAVWRADEAAAAAGVAALLDAQLAALEAGPLAARLVALRVRHAGRPKATAAWLGAAQGDVGVLRAALEALCAEAETAQALLLEVQRALACLTPAAAPAALRPRLRGEESALLWLLATNAAERRAAVAVVVRMYRGLSPAALGVPPGGGPGALAAAVGTFVRETPAGPVPAAGVFTAEAHNAMGHYGLPLSLLEGVLGAEAEAAALRGAQEAAGPAPRPVRRQATAALARRAAAPEEVRDAWAVAAAERVRVSSAALSATMPTGRGAGTAAGRNHRAAAAALPPAAHDPPTEGRQAQQLLEVQAAAAAATRALDWAAAADLHAARADLEMLLQRPEAAARAVEAAQTAALLAALLPRVVPLLAGAEGRAWRQAAALLTEQPLEDGGVAHTRLLAQLTAASPVYARLRRALEAPPAEVDGAVLTAARDVAGERWLLSLRLPGAAGAISHCAPYDAAALRRARARYADLQARAAQQLLETPGAPLAPEPMAGFLAELAALLAPLWGDASPLGSVLLQLPPATPLFLCVDAALQPLPLERAAPLAAHGGPIARELGAAFVALKQAQRTGRAGAAVLPLVDPFGDHPHAVDALAQVTKGKASASPLLLTSGAGTDGVRFAPAPAFVAWRMQQEDCGAVLVSLCGSLSELLPPRTLASLALDHVGVMVVGSEAVCGSAVAREQRGDLQRTADERADREKWLTSLILLLRGVTCLATNTHVVAPEANDVLCGRMFSCLPSGRGLAEAAAACAAAGLPVTLYGVPPPAAKGK